MKVFTNRLLTAQGLVILMVTAGLWTAPRLMAAIKAAIVQNVDEPGRNPYQGTTSGECGFSTCNLGFPPVPVGKRLVVTHVSGFIGLSPGSLYRHADLAGQQLPFTSRGQVNGVEEFITNETVLTYFEAGDTPLVRLVFNTQLQGQFGFVVSGYYINLP